VLVSDMMTRDVVSVRPDMPLREVASLLIERNIGGVPVTDGDGVVLGVVSESDFVFKELGPDHDRPSRLARMFGRTDPTAAKLAATTAGEAMTTPAVTIEGYMTFVREAAMLMSQHGVNRLPVTAHGRLVGIVTRSDIVRVFAQPDRVLEERVRDAIRAVGDSFVEDVSDGVVTLAGTMATHELVDDAVDIVRAVDGVVAVNTERLTWAEQREVTKASAR
jgi:CBS domain-containing protein